jgi:hypothetical protein
LILLLNDEQPDIRYYICESAGIQSVIDSSLWHIGGGDGGQQETVKINDQVIVELIFKDFTDKVLASAD